MTRLMGFELRKVWMGRLFALLVAVLASANLLLLWMGARPSAGQPSAESWRRLGAELSAMPMEQRGDFLHGKVEECGAIINIESYYRQLAYGDSEYLRSFRDEYDEVFRKYEQEYLDKSYSVYTDDLYTDYALFGQAASEYDTVAAYPEFLADIQTKTNQLAGISIFQNDSTGYDMRNIELTAAVYAGMEGTVIDYYPQKGLYTALSYPFTDLLLLAAMLLLALLLVRQERDSGLLCLVRSQPAGRLKTALAKLAAFALSLLAVLALLYGGNLLWCGATYGLGPLGRSIQSVPTLMRCTMSITVSEYLVRFLLAKWAGAFVMGLWVMLAALAARRTAAGWVGALALPLAMYGIRAAIPATSRLNVVKYANLVSLMQTNELLGNYRNLFWFGWPVGLPLVEWTAAVVYGGLLLTGFCLLFARGQLLPTAKRGFVLFARRARRTRPTTVFRAEGRKLFVTGKGGTVPGSLPGIRCLAGRDGTKLHRPTGDLLCFLHETTFRPLYPGKRGLFAGRTGRIHPLPACPTAGDAGRAFVGGTLCVCGDAAKIQRLYSGGAAECERLPETPSQGLAGLRERLPETVLPG